MNNLPKDSKKETAKKLEPLKHLYSRDKNATITFKGKKMKFRVYIRMLAVNLAELSDEPMLAIRKELIAEYEKGGLENLHSVYLQSLDIIRDTRLEHMQKLQDEQQARNEAAKGELEDMLNKTQK